MSPGKNLRVASNNCTARMSAGLSCTTSLNQPSAGNHHRTSPRITSRRAWASAEVALMHCVCAGRSWNSAFHLRRSAYSRDCSTDCWDCMKCASCGVFGRRPPADVTSCTGMSLVQYGRPRIRSAAHPVNVTFGVHIVRARILEIMWCEYANPCALALAPSSCSRMLRSSSTGR